MNNRGHLFICYYLTLKLSPLPHFQNPKYREINGFPGRAEIIRRITRFCPKWYSFWPTVKKIFLTPVTRCGSLCTIFPAALEKMYHQGSIWACCPDLKIRNFSPEGQLSQGRNVCRLKAGWLLPHCQWTSPDKAERIIMILLYPFLLHYKPCFESNINISPLIAFFHKWIN